MIVDLVLPKASITELRLPLSGINLLTTRKKYPRTMFPSKK